MKKESRVKRVHFSLIELLIVVGILGALTGLILPSFYQANDDAKEKIALNEMHEIQRAFQRFYSDTLNQMRIKESYNGTDHTNRYLQDIALYGLWPLLIETHPNAALAETILYDLYQVETGFGHRVPYIEMEGIVEIGNPSMIFQKESDLGGQGESDSGESSKIPVIKDPYGGYYRVLCPEARLDSKGGNNLHENKRLLRMVLVCTGPNQKLETYTNSFIETTADNYIKTINGDNLKAQGDDIIVRLLPTAF